MSKDSAPLPAYPVITRFGLLLRPQAPFFAWLRQVHPEEEDAFDPDFWEPNCYLIPELFNPAEEDAWLKQHFGKLLDHELAQAAVDEDQWPEARTYELFRKWFVPEVIGTIFDTVRGQIEKG